MAKLYKPAGSLLSILFLIIDWPICFNGKGKMLRLWFGTYRFRACA